MDALGVRRRPFRLKARGEDSRQSFGKPSVRRAGLETRFPEGCKRLRGVRAVHSRAILARNLNTSKPRPLTVRDPESDPSPKPRVVETPTLLASRLRVPLLRRLNWAERLAKHLVQARRADDADASGGCSDCASSDLRSTQARRRDRTSPRWSGSAATPTVAQGWANPRRLP